MANATVSATGTNIDIEVIEGNDPQFTFTCRRREGTTSVPVNLTGTEVEFILKPDATVSDTDAQTIKYTVANGNVVIRTQTGDNIGKVDVFAKATDLLSPGRRVYRLNVISAGRTLTYAYGRLKIIDV